MGAFNDYDIRFKRIYEPAEPADGTRVLVDRLWPRGKRKEELGLTEWYRHASPSPALRRAWHQSDINWENFRRDYLRELSQDPNLLTPLLRYARQSRLTLLTAARQPDRSHLPILREALLNQLELEDREAEGRDCSSPPCFDR